MASETSAETSGQTEQRKIIASEFVSLDGVMEAPDEWHLPYFNDEMDEAVGAGMAEADAMLMGRVTYEEWSAFFPSQSGEDADYMNNIPKFIVSTTLDEVEWQNSTLINENVTEEITKLKQQTGGALSISGSGTLVRSLLRTGLLDELRLMVHPIVVGDGKRLFDESDEETALELVDSETFDTGVVYNTYRPAERETKDEDE